MIFERTSTYSLYTPYSIYFTMVVYMCMYTQRQEQVQDKLCEDRSLSGQFATSSPSPPLAPDVCMVGDVVQGSSFGGLGDVEAS